MTDIAERLTIEAAYMRQVDPKMLADAASEIERLRVALRLIAGMLDEAAPNAYEDRAVDMRDAAREALQE